MKNYNIFGVHWKIQLLGRGFTKKQYRGGLGQFAGLRETWQERVGGIFLRGEGVDTPMHTMP